jgi:hypothetical protein
LLLFLSPPLQQRIDVSVEPSGPGSAWPSSVIVGHSVILLLSTVVSTPAATDHYSIQRQQRERAVLELLPGVARAMYDLYGLSQLLFQAGK